MSTWQRTQLWGLGQSADILFFSIERWAQRFARWFPNTPVHHLPVGSNIPRVQIAREEARARLGIEDETLVLGLFGTAHISRMLSLVRRAADALNAERKILILYIGPDGPAVQALLDGLPVLAEGPLGAAEVSRRFAAMDIALTPFLDGVSTRRTSMMTGLQHGIATVGTYGVWTDPSLKALDGTAFLLADVNNPIAFCRHLLRLAQDDALRQRMGEVGRELHDREFCWPAITNRLLQALPVPVLTAGANLRGDILGQEIR